MEQKQIILQNQVEQVSQLAQFIEEVCQQLSLDMATTMSINLAVEEAVVNVMNYAYPPGTLGQILIQASCTGHELQFVITDSGQPFDPTAHAGVDTTLSAEERPIGGLGIHLVRQIMDAVAYQRLQGRNVLTLSKQITNN